MTIITTNYIDSSDGSTGSGADLGNQLVPKDYLISVYPHLMSTAKIPMLWICGYNLYGSLGDNTSAHKSSPVQTISGGTNWARPFTGGHGHTMVIKTDGTLWGWGENTHGQLGDNTNTNYKSSPVQTTAGGTTWKTGGNGHHHFAAIKTDGTLWTCGYNFAGQLGIGSTTSKSTPVQVGALTTWKLVTGGVYHAAAIKTDGTLWTWGYNLYGQLGDGTITNRSSPVQVGSATTWKLVACGNNITTAIKTDGTLWTCGYNTFGGLGDGTVLHRSSPVQITGTNWKQTAGGFAHTTAIKTDGTLWAWGWNDQGQVGDNTVAHKSSPVQTVASGTNWKQVTNGRQHTAAIKTDGTLWTWGRDDYGQLGDNTTVTKSSPVQTVVGGTNWKQVVCSMVCTTAIAEGGGW